MLNITILHGYIGRDPEIKEYQGKNGPFKKATFTLGVSRDFGDETDWFFVTMNGKKAEVVEKYCRKGSEILVVGRVEDYHPKGETTRTDKLVRAYDFNFCGKASGGGKQQENLAETFEEIEEDVPF